MIKDKPERYSIPWWSEQIDKGLSFRYRYGYSKYWVDTKKYYRGQYAEGMLPYNIIYGIIRALLPNIYMRNPYVSIGVRNPELAIHARILESLDNWLIQELAIKKVMKKAIFRACLMGNGFIKVGYDSLYGMIDETDQQRLERLFNEAQPDYNMKRTEYDINVKPGMPWAVSPDTSDVVVPFGAVDIDNIPFMAQRMYRRTEDVKADKRFKHTSEIKGSHAAADKYDRSGVDFYQQLMEADEYTELWEVRDFRHRKLRTYATNFEKNWLVDVNDAMQIDGMSYINICFNEDPDYFWGIPDAHVITPQQLELNEARTQAMKHRRISLIKFLVATGAIDNEEILKMTGEEVGPAIRIKTTTGDVSKAVHILQPHIPPDLVSWGDVVRQDAREIIGMGRNQSGEYAEGKSSRRTAMEAQIVQAAHDIRLDERRDISADALALTVRKINQVIFKKWTTERVVEVVGFDGLRSWVKIKPSMLGALANEYSTKVDVESQVPSTKAMKMNQIGNLIQTLSKVPGANVNVLLRQLLRHHEWVDAMEILPQNSQMSAVPQQEYMQQQTKLLQKGQQGQNA